MFEKNKRINYTELKEFSRKVMRKAGCSEEEAEIVADVLVEADLRGIHSHGVSRLKRYVQHIKERIIEPNKEPDIILETDVSLVVDGNNGVGQYIANKVVSMVTKKAKTSGICIATVRNANHYGIAGYYAEKIAKNNMIGIALTNTAPLVVPTFSKNMLLGTNPIAFAIPANSKIILVDMATSIVSRGKLELYSRQREKIPLGWAVNQKGKGTDDPDLVLENMKNRSGGGLLPLGGEGELFGGHKGYGLSLLVELLTGGLSLGNFSYETYNKQGGISFFFMAIDLNIFGDAESIKKHINKLLVKIKNSEKAENCERICIHGEKEHEKRKENILKGIMLDDPTIETLNELDRLYRKLF